MKQAFLVACCHPTDSVWQLGDLTKKLGRVFLIGWNRSAVSNDGAPPSEVRNVIVQAFTQVANVAYLSPAKWAISHAMMDWAPLKRGGLLGWFRCMMRGVGPQAGLCRAKQPDDLLRAFDVPGFPWTMQGQVMLLQSPGIALGGVEVSAILSLMEDGWMDVATGLGRQGLMAVARPGVDGAVLGVFCTTPQIQATLLTAFAEAAGEAGVGWAVLTEDAFKAHLSSWGETKRGG